MAAKKRRQLVSDEGATTPPPAAVIPIKRTVTKAADAPGFFATLKSNVKGGVDVPLGPCTAIVSERNRAGKTAVLDAFRLALTGTHHIGQHAVDLMGLTADGSTPWAHLDGAQGGLKLIFPDGKRTPVLQQSGELTKFDPKQLREWLPLVAIEELLSLGTAKAREELFRRFGPNVPVTPPPTLAEPQLKLWHEVLNVAQGDIVERLSNAGTLIRAKKNALSAVLRGLDDERARLHATQLVVGAPTDDLVRGLEEKLDAWKAYRGQQMRTGRGQSLEDLGQRLVTAVEAFKALPQVMTPEELQEAHAAAERMSDVPAHKAMATEALKAAEAVEKNLQVFQLVRGLRARLPQHGCAVCLGTTHLKHDELLAAAEQQVAALTEQLAPLRAAVQAAQQRFSEKLDEVARAQASINHDQNTLRWRHQTAKDAVLTLKSAYEAAQAAQGEVALPEPTEAEDVIRQQLIEVQNARASAARLTVIAKEQRQGEMEALDLKTVEQVLGETLDRLLVTVQAAAEKAVNAWLLEGFKAKLVLSDADGKSVCRWEIVGEDGRSHPRGAMSGAEWASLVIALACAWSEGREHRFLLLDDTDLSGFNAANINAIMSMVAKAVADGRLTQAVVAWSRPAEVPSNGWSVVSL